MTRKSTMFFSILFSLLFLFLIPIFKVALADPLTKPCPDNPSDTCIDTAIGLIPTSPAGLVSKLFSVLLGLSGGIALILIIISGYRLMTSGANAEAVQGARETLTSAIVGLLFIIFSLVILEVVGVDILKIPGLNK